MWYQGVGGSSIKVVTQEIIASTSLARVIHTKAGIQYFNVFNLT